jgi:hypothetical protein
LLEVHVAVYPMIALPLGLDAVKLTVNGPLDEVVEPGTAFTLTAGPGAPTITVGDGEDACPGPRAFVAVTVHVYVLASVSAMTEIGLELPVADPGVPPSVEVHDAL